MRTRLHAVVKSCGYGIEIKFVMHERLEGEARVVLLDKLHRCHEVLLVVVVKALDRVDLPHQLFGADLQRPLRKSGPDKDHRGTL